MIYKDTILFSSIVWFIVHTRLKMCYSSPCCCMSVCLDLNVYGIKIYRW